MSDANETAWTAEGGKAIPNAVNEGSEGAGFQPGDGVIEEAGELQEVSSPNRTPEEEFLAQMLAATGATNLEEAGLYDPAEVAAEEERIEEEMSPEERQAKAEHDALAAAFSMIRERSNEGKLTTPGTWAAAGIVPDHLIPVDFSDLAFDEIIAAQAASAAAKKVAEEAAQAAVADAVSADSGVEGVAASCSKADEVAGENAPSVDEGDSLDSEIETPEWKLDDIKVLEGKQTYLYSSDYMTDTYAHWAFLAEEGDDTLTLVENAREESRLYPRPMLAASLSSKPYYWNDEQIEQAWQAVQESGSYPDIKTCEASNGERYFYSTDYLSDAQAKALAEWYSVERYMNV
ncbi:hypothetical protein [Slackia sp.]|uniref:hypothetical protein n=1 Tax=Slackia sp. TaxID=2049041 RepID=UPI00257A9C95|nr:hypothetical protein [Slackia sp.]